MPKTSIIWTTTKMNSQPQQITLCDKTVFILWQVLTHAEASTHHLIALSLQGHLQAAAQYSPDDVILLEVCNKSSGDWQLATLLLACRCCQLLGATPPTGTDSTPLQGMVCACIKNLPLFAPENLLQANVIRSVSTHNEGHGQFGVATFCIY